MTYIRMRASVRFWVQTGCKNAPTLHPISLISLRKSFRKCFGMYGGDDGSGTRDLCRGRGELQGVCILHWLRRGAVEAVRHKVRHYERDALLYGYCLWLRVA